jgi:hypothetical protein
MGWAFIVLSLTWRRRLLVGLLCAAFVVLLVVAYALGARDNACEPPPLDEMSEAYLLDNPECADGGAR